MYLGLDTLTINGQLAPVQWTSYSPSLGRYQGSLLSRDKEVVHQAFLAKIKRAEQEGADAAEMDWTGVHRIIDCIVHAFD